MLSPHASYPAFMPTLLPFGKQCGSLPTRACTVDAQESNFLLQLSKQLLLWKPSSAVAQALIGIAEKHPTASSIIVDLANSLGSRSMVLFQ